MTRYEITGVLGSVAALVLMADSIAFSLDQATPSRPGGCYTYFDIMFGAEAGAFRFLQLGTSIVFLILSILVPWYLSRRQARETK
jgi:hypothetical protein